MRPALVFVVLAIAILRGSAQILRRGQCPKIVPLKRLDVPKYMGLWYEQVHTRRWTGLELKCSEEYFTPMSNFSFQINSFTYSPIANRTFHIQGTAEVNTSGPSQGTIHINIPTLKLSGEVWVLGTDYTSYTLMWSCINADRLHFENIVVMTREVLGSKSRASVGQALQVLAKNRILRSQLQYTSHYECPKIETGTKHAAQHEVDTALLPGSVQTISQHAAPAPNPAHHEMTQAPRSTASTGTSTQQTNNEKKESGRDTKKVDVEVAKNDTEAENINKYNAEHGKSAERAHDGTSAFVPSPNKTQPTSVKPAPAVSNELQSASTKGIVIKQALGNAVQTTEVFERGATVKVLSQHAGVTQPSSILNTAPLKVPSSTNDQKFVKSPEDKPSASGPETRIVFPVPDHTRSVPQDAQLVKSTNVVAAPRREGQMAVTSKVVAENIQVDDPSPEAANMKRHSTGAAETIGLGSPAIEVGSVMPPVVTVNPSHKQ